MSSLCPSKLMSCSQDIIQSVKTMPNKTEVTIFNPPSFGHIKNIKKKIKKIDMSLEIIILI
jgi:hypothetical protein